jgi:hypothetical protein
MSFPNIDPDFTQHIDTAASTLTTEERRYLRWTPKYGGRWTLIEAIIAAAIFAGIAIVFVLWIF